MSDSIVEFVENKDGDADIHHIKAVTNILIKMEPLKKIYSDTTIQIM